MAIFPETPELGRLELVEVYAFYDEPVLFTARNELDGLFLATLAEDTENSQKWLYAPMSKRRFEEVRSGGVDLQQAFKAAESGYVYVLNVPKSPKAGSKIRRVKVEELSDGEVPEYDVRLDVPTETLRTREHIDVVRNAQQIRKEVLALRFNFDHSLRTEAPAGLLGQLLDAFQQVVTAVGQATLGKGTARGTIPQDITEQMTLSFADVFPSSFGVELHANKELDLFGYSPAGEALAQIVQLFESSKSDEELVALLKELKGRTTQKYRRFLECFGSGVRSLEVHWGSPLKDKEWVTEVTAETAFNAVNTITEMEPSEPLIYNIVARLVGINVRIKTYEVWEIAENRKYSGKILDEALPMVEHATINNVYLVTIREETEVTATGDLETKYRLLSLVNRGVIPESGSTD